MFDHAHYVPVLRWKRRERWALEALSPPDRDGLTPIIEPLPGYMRRRQQDADDLSCVVDQLVKCSGATPVFVDLTRVASTPFRGRVTHNAEGFFAALGRAGLRAIPVTSPNQSPCLQGAIRDVLKGGHTGAAIRVPVSLIYTGRASRELRTLMAHLGIEPEEVDRYSRGLWPRRRDTAAVQLHLPPTSGGRLLTDVHGPRWLVPA